MNLTLKPWGSGHVMFMTALKIVIQTYGPKESDHINHRKCIYSPIKNNAVKITAISNFMMIG